MTTSEPSIWLALLHQLPVKPPYLRVKIWRRLQAIGAVPLKNAVHVLPLRDEHEAAFRILMAEIIDGGGEATLLEARMLGGQSDGDIRAMFDAARDSDYDDIAQAARRLIDTGPASGADIAKLQKRMADVVQLDFFGAHGRQHAEATLADLDRQRYLHPDVRRDEPAADLPRDLKGRTWVTRSGVHVDRIACAWLIRRFIDPDATFRFVDGRSYAPQKDELRFDMADAEFTHEGEHCSFETLVERGGLTDDPALVAIAEIIHDLDIADGKFARPETAGLGAMLSGVCASTDDDLQRIATASDALNQFHAYFSNRKADR
ncbi:Protein ChrB [Sphingobium sp. AntQ-1]|uniref:chromate resistance protein ChrB domain-containing protein n=1 Tax=Sphingobium sp. AntQ-1 TaxID=2930091 RepID=UPI00234F3F9C|nr:chromate resistance protein ChrB domain-containing protein [Sphingobium sp. AntQ-1]WCP13765.1 Protein ChrB [Sphingobium sp. AntQ-1]